MNILVPVDGTEHSLRAVEFLTTRTDLLGAAPKITIFFSQHPVPQRMITSLEPLTIKDYYAEEAESLFASVRALLGDTKLNIEMHYAVGSPAEAGSLLTNVRQESAVRRGLVAVRRAAAALKTGLTPDAVLTDAEEALNAVGELTGRTARDEIVNAVFSRFCVGK